MSREEFFQGVNKYLDYKMADFKDIFESIKIGKEITSYTRKYFQNGQVQYERELEEMNLNGLYLLRQLYKHICQVIISFPEEIVKKYNHLIAKPFSFMKFKLFLTIVSSSNDPKLSLQCISTPAVNNIIYEFQKRELILEEALYPIAKEDIFKILLLLNYIERGEGGLLNQDLASITPLKFPAISAITSRLSDTSHLMDIVNISNFCQLETTSYKLPLNRTLLSPNTSLSSKQLKKMKRKIEKKRSKQNRSVSLTRVQYDTPQSKHAALHRLAMISKLVNDSLSDDTKSLSPTTDWSAFQWCTAIKQQNIRVYRNMIKKLENSCAFGDDIGNEISELFYVVVDIIEARYQNRPVLVDENYRSFWEQIFAHEMNIFDTPASNLAKTNFERFENLRALECEFLKLEVFEGDQFSEREKVDIIINACENILSFINISPTEIAKYDQNILAEILRTKEGSSEYINAIKYNISQIVPHLISCFSLITGALSNSFLSQKNYISTIQRYLTLWTEGLATDSSIFFIISALLIHYLPGLCQYKQQTGDNGSQEMNSVLEVNHRTEIVV